MRNISICIFVRYLNGIVWAAATEFHRQHTVLEFHIEIRVRGSQNFCASGFFPLVNVEHGQPQTGECCILDAVQPVLRPRSYTEHFHENWYCTDSCRGLCTIIVSIFITSQNFKSCTTKITPAKYYVASGCNRGYKCFLR